MNTLVFGGVFLRKISLASLNIFIYLHTPTRLSDPLCMKQLKLTLHMLKLFYYSRKRWPCRLEDALITANVYSTTGNRSSSVLNKPLGTTTSPPVWSSDTRMHRNCIARGGEGEEICLNSKSEKLQHQVYWVIVRRGRKKVEQQQNGGKQLFWEKPSIPRRGCFACHSQHVPGGDLGRTLKVGLKPSSLQRGLIFQTPPISTPSFSPGTKRGREAATAGG